MAIEVNDPLSADGVRFFNDHGWILSEPFPDVTVAQLADWVGEVATWPDHQGDWLHYREDTAHGLRLCRSENFIPFHRGLRELLTTGVLPLQASSLIGEPAVLYKEKINYKLAGGAGYSAHQDAPAYPFVETHVSCMIAVDDTDEANGCLEVVDAMHQQVLAMDDRGCVAADIVSGLTWQAVPVAAGQVLWFHSRTPHRSAANRSPNDRRALYPTYNAAAQGDLRAAYYARKLAEFARTDAEQGRVRVSLIGDFEGIAR